MNLTSQNWLKDAGKILNSLKNLGIAGRSNLGAMTNIEDGIPPRPIFTSQITVSMKLKNLNEFLMIIPPKKFQFSLI